MQLSEVPEGSVDFGFVAGFHDDQLHALRARRFLNVFSHGPGVRPGRILDEGNSLGLGNQLGKQIKALRVKLE